MSSLENIPNSMVVEKNLKWTKFILNILLWGFLASYGVLTILVEEYDVFSASQIVGMQTFFFTTTLLVAASVLFLAGIIFPKDRRGWWSFSIGAILFAGVSLYSNIEHLSTSPDDGATPAVIVAFLVIFGFLVYGQNFLLRSFKIRKENWLDAIVLAAAIGAVLTFIYSETFGGSWSLEEDFSSIVFFIIGIVFLAKVFAAAGSIGWVANGVWATLLAASLLWWLTNSAIYLQHIAFNDSHYVMSFGWLFSFVLYAIAPYQKRPPVRDHTPFIVAITPVLSASLALFILLYATQRTVSPVAILFATVVIILGGFRAVKSVVDEAKNREKAKLAFVDDLTLLPNRRWLNDAIEQKEPSLEYPGAPWSSILLMDLDSFKEINDTLGHMNGDKVLRILGQRISQVLDNDDVISRLGGDEFAVLLSSEKDLMDAEQIAINIRKSVSEIILLEDVELSLDISIGIFHVVSNKNNIEDALRAADVAMYRAKRNRLGQAVYQKRLDRSSKSQLLLGQQLKRAVNQGEFVCRYQPQFNLETGELTAVETLIRWQHPDHGLLHPGVFIPFIEAAGLTDGILLNVMTLSLEDMAIWKEKGYDITVAVNLSGANLLNEKTPKQVAELLENFGRGGEKIVLEITETAALEYSDPLRKAADELRALGCIISIDDYGTSHSSLMQVRELSAKQIKLDKTFVTGLANDESRSSIVSSTATMARDLDLDLVAEGIETLDDLFALQKLGITFGQGYYLAPPLCSDELIYWIEEYEKNLADKQVEWHFCIPTRLAGSALAKVEEKTNILESFMKNNV